jgi:hypothetical protein
MAFDRKRLSITVQIALAVALALALAFFGQRNAREVKPAIPPLASDAPNPP